MGRPGTLLFFSLLLAVCLGLEGQTVTIGGFPSIAPWVLVNRQASGADVVEGGIVKDLCDLITAKTGITFRFYFPPRRRMELEIEERRLDVLPLANPAWLTKSEVLEWSGPLIPEKKVFVTLTKSPVVIRSGADLKGLRLGLITGFVYPELSESLGFLRDDADTVVRNLRKLEFGRLDGVYASDIDVMYRLKLMKSIYTVQPWSPAGLDYQWGVVKRLGPVKDRILAAVQGLKRDGSLNQILSRYR